VSDDPQEAAESLRATSDQLVIAIAETGALERQKRGVSPSDPAFPALALEVRRAAERVLLLARQEEVTARDTQESAVAPAMPPIDQVSPAKELAGILEQWRAVEHRLLEVPGESPEGQELMRQFEELRVRYAQALKAREARHDS
jgi:hypothetical protein